MQDAHAVGMFGFIPVLLISLPFAIGFFHVAPKMGRNSWTWAILSLIPVVNYLFWIYAWFVIVMYTLDRLNESRSART